MSWIAGADGCRKGWFRVARKIETGALRFDVVETADDLLARPPKPEILGLDIPIGLTDAGRRACDDAARAVLGWPRRNSVFPAPIRPALHAATREEASVITQRADGRRVGTQAWALYPKIRTVDALLRSGSSASDRIREVHPEVSFWAWNGNVPMRHGKKTANGRHARLRLAEEWLGEGILDLARNGYLKKDVADDDILDAIAALWTAIRIRSGDAQTLPEAPTRDSEGLRMEIVH